MSEPSGNLQSPPPIMLNVGGRGVWQGEQLNSMSTGASNNKYHCLGVYWVLGTELRNHFLQISLFEPYDPPVKSVLFSPLHKETEAWRCYTTC